MTTAEQKSALLSLLRSGGPMALDEILREVEWLLKGSPETWGEFTGSIPEMLRQLERDGRVSETDGCWQWLSAPVEKQRTLFE